LAGSGDPALRSFAPPRYSRASHQALRLSKGFTLVELLIGMALALMVMTAMLSTYTYLGRSLARLVNQQTLETESRRALAYFAQDVRMASGISGTPSATRVDLNVPTGSGSNTITYYYNDSSADTPVTLNGNNVTMVANSLTRCVYDGTTVTSLTLCRNITGSGLTFTYYDSSGSSYTGYTDYLPGIKQISLSFSCQKGNSFNGTQTPVQPVASARLILRNHPLLQ
jgi:prepilin-type N-terminal cleavage/methylation domain-containing protein